MVKYLDLVGQRFGRLLVLEKFGSVKQRIFWTCICDCGKRSNVQAAMLRNGNTRSCGCLGIEARAVAAAKVNKTHGLSKSPTYGIWFGMKRRCQSPSHKSYALYGGRGIKVCDAWQTFEGFVADMGERPSDGLSIERKNTNGDYEPGNCVWATWKEQQNNRRNNRIVEVDGKRLTVQQWAEVSGISYDAILKRLDAGWSACDAVTAPMKADRRRALGWAAS